MRNLLDSMFAGRGNDTLLAHITPREAAILKALGGSGNINPRTGLPEFWEGAEAEGSYGGDYGGGGYGDGGNDSVDVTGDVSVSIDGVDVGPNVGVSVDPSSLTADAPGFNDGNAAAMPGVALPPAEGTAAAMPGVALPPAGRVISENLGADPALEGPQNATFGAFGSLPEAFRGYAAWGQTNPFGAAADFADRALPDMSTVLGFLGGGLLSGVTGLPGLGLLGAWAAKKGKEEGWAFGPPDQATLDSMNSDTLGNGGDGGPGLGPGPGPGSGGGYYAPAATTRGDVAASNVAGTRANYNPDWNSIWSELAQRGMGGGGVSRLFSERVSGLSSLPAESQPGNIEGIMAQLRAAGASR